jgi:hypothetical protein
MLPHNEKARVSPRVPERADVLAELGRVLNSAAFSGSRRCHDFLQYVVTKSLDGNHECLKERTLAAEVFGRKLAADLSEDTIVRVGAREVRKRLAQYYMVDGVKDAVRIDLPVGSYAPQFHYLEEAPAIVPAEPEEEPPVIAKPASLEAKPRRWWWLAVGAALLLTAAAAVVMQARRQVKKEFELFWRPAISARGPVLIVVPHPIVYFPTERAYRLHEQRHPGPEQALQTPLDVPGKELTGDDFVPVFQQFVGFGDLVACSKLTRMFGLLDKDARVRMASKTEFSDMRDSTVVLLGAFTNRWTIELTQQFRYRFRLDAGNKPSIVDSRTGTRRWALEKTDSGYAREDYILVCRLPKSETGGFLYLGAGLTGYGTEEVGRILTDPEALLPLLWKLPAGWETKNVELFLHSRIVGGASTEPELIAFEIW